MARVIRAVILRVENQEVAAGEEIDEVVLGLLRTRGGGRLAGLNRETIRFVIGQIRDRAPGCFNPETGAAARMIQADRAHVERTERRCAAREFIDRGDAGEEMQRHRKLDRVHLRAQRGLDFRARARPAEDVQSIRATVGRAEKREALDVIPMGVREEQIRGQRLARELESEPAQAAPGIEDEPFRAAAQLDAGSVTAVFHGLRSRRGNGPAHAPEVDGECGGQVRQ